MRTTSSDGVVISGPSSMLLMKGYPTSCLSMQDDPEILLFRVVQNPVIRQVPNFSPVVFSDSARSMCPKFRIGLIILVKASFSSTSLTSLLPSNLAMLIPNVYCSRFPVAPSSMVWTLRASQLLIPCHLVSPTALVNIPAKPRPGH